MLCALALAARIPSLAATASVAAPLVVELGNAAGTIAPAGAVMITRTAWTSRPPMAVTGSLLGRTRLITRLRDKNSPKSGSFETPIEIVP